jgi:hypothetical protein
MNDHYPSAPARSGHVEHLLSGTAVKQGRIDDYTVITHINKVTRRQNTSSGNPRWRLLTRHGVFETAPDSQIGYAIVREWSHHLEPVMRLKLDDAGDVIDIAAVEGPPTTDDAA